MEGVHWGVQESVSMYLFPISNGLQPVQSQQLAPTHCGLSANLCSLDVPINYCVCQDHQEETTFPVFASC